MASCEHDHDCGDHDCGALWTLYQSVDVPKVTCLNELVEGRCQKIFKPWDKRLEHNDDEVLESNEDDPELLLHVPFVADVKIKSICIVGGAGGSSPATLKVWINRDDVDFSTAADSPGVQEWDLAENTNGHLEYQTKAAKFQGVGSLTMFFGGNFGASSTKVHFVGFKGESTQAGWTYMVIYPGPGALPCKLKHNRLSRGWRSSRL